MDGLVAKGRNGTFTGHSHHLIKMEGHNWFVGYIIHDHPAKLGLYISHQPGDLRGGPWHSQLGDLTFLDHPIMRYRVEVPRITSHSVMPGSSITMAIWSLSYPWTQGTLTFIMTNPMGSTKMPSRPLMSGMDPRSLVTNSPRT